VLGLAIAAQLPAPSNAANEAALSFFEPPLDGFSSSNKLGFLEGETLEECAALCLSWKGSKPGRTTACRAFQYSAKSKKCGIKKVRSTNAHQTHAPNCTRSHRM